MEAKQIQTKQVTRPDRMFLGNMRNYVRSISKGKERRGQALQKQRKSRTNLFRSESCQRLFPLVSQSNVVWFQKERRAIHGRLDWQFPQPAHIQLLDLEKNKYTASWIPVCERAGNVQAVFLSCFRLNLTIAS